MTGSPSGFCSNLWYFWFTHSLFSFTFFFLFASRQRGSQRPEEDGLLRHWRGGGRPPEEPDEQLPSLHGQPAGNRLARQQGEITNITEYILYSTFDAVNHADVRSKLPRGNNQIYCMYFFNRSFCFIAVVRLQWISRPTVLNVGAIITVWPRFMFYGHILTFKLTFFSRLLWVSRKEKYNDTKYIQWQQVLLLLLN